MEYRTSEFSLRNYSNPFMQMNYYTKEFKICESLVKQNKLSVHQEEPSSSIFKENNCFLFNASLTADLQKIVMMFGLGFDVEKGQKRIKKIGDFSYIEARVKHVEGLKARVVKKKFSQEELLNQQVYILIHVFRQDSVVFPEKVNVIERTSLAANQMQIFPKLSMNYESILVEENTKPDFTDTRTAQKRDLNENKTLRDQLRFGVKCSQEQQQKDLAKLKKKKQQKLSEKQRENNLNEANNLLLPRNTLTLTIFFDQNHSCC